MKLTTREARSGLSKETLILNGEGRLARYYGFMENVRIFFTSRHHYSNEGPFLQQDLVKASHRTQ